MSLHLNQLSLICFSSTNTAVCSFELKTRDGVELKGVVKELSQAKKEYDEACSKGWSS